MDYLGEDVYPAPPLPQASHESIMNERSFTINNHGSSNINGSHDSPGDPQTPQADGGLQPYTPEIYSSDPYGGMPPPPEISYESLPALMNACQEHGRQHGYACVTSSNNYKRGIAYVRCDRGGEYVNHWNVTPETRIRKNRTRRLVGCKWKARAKRVGEDGEWQLTMMHDKHTGHGPSSDLATHPSLRQLPEEAVSAAKNAFGLGRTPKEVLEILKQWNDAVTAQDIYNLKARLTRKDSTPGGSGVGKRIRRTQIQQSQQSTPIQSIQAQEDGIVDPALRAADDANLGGMGRLQAAVAQMQASGQPRDGLLVQGTGSHGPDGKCTCTCCDH